MKDVKGSTVPCKLRLQEGGEHAAQILNVFYVYKALTCKYPYAFPLFLLEGRLHFCNINDKTITGMCLVSNIKLNKRDCSRLI